MDYRMYWLASMLEGLKHTWLQFSQQAVGEQAILIDTDQKAVLLPSCDYEEGISLNATTAYLSDI